MSLLSIKNPKHLIITGASSGIGRALAVEYAAPGIVLGLTGRNEARLQDTARACRDKGASVDFLAADIQDTEKITRWMRQFDQQHPVDLVISNAGISGGPKDQDALETDAELRHIFEVNVFAAIQVAQALYDAMKARGYGQIALTGSIAGFQGWAGAPAYIASKAALHAYAESLRMKAHPHHLCVTIIAPGFVDTAMTAKNEFPMPFMIAAEHAARRIRNGLARNRRYIIFPKRMYLLSLLARITPESLLLRLAGKINGKSPLP